MKPIYYGWWLVAIAVVSNALVYGTIYNAFQLYVAPASKEYGLSRADMNTAMVFLSFGSAALAPVIGRLVDFVSTRLVMIVGALMLGGSFLVLGLTHSVWLSAAMFAVPLAVSVQCAQLTLPFLLNRWFLRQRGRAMALAAIGISLGFIFTVPVVGILITRYGWRETLLILSGAVTAILVGMALLVRERPREGEVEPGKAPPPASIAAPAQSSSPMKLGAILRMPQFWTISLGAGLGGAVSSALAVSFVPLAQARGLPLLAATALVPLMGMSGIAVKLLLGAIADKVSRVYLLVAIFLIIAAANFVLLVDRGSGLSLAGCALALGIGGGAMAPLLYALLGDRFGAASFGTVAGLLLPITMVSVAVATRFAGAVFDRTGDYHDMYLAFAAASLAAAGVMFATRFTRAVGADRASA